MPMVRVSNGGSKVNAWTGTGRNSSNGTFCTNAVPGDIYMLVVDYGNTNPTPLISGAEVLIRGMYSLSYSGTIYFNTILVRATSSTIRVTNYSSLLEFRIYGSLSC